MLDNFYEKVMHVYTEGKNRIELHKARTQFFEWAGQFDETSNDFEVKMTLFADWYLIDRPYSDGITPLNKIESEDIELSEQEHNIVSGLKSSTHAIFEFLKLKKDQLYIRDLYTKQKFLVSDFSILSAFNKEQFFEARILKLEDKFIFTGSFCFHPPQSKKYILRQYKILKKLTKKLSQEEKNVELKKVMNKLFRMKHKSDQYKHVKIEEIYCEDSKVRV